MPAIPAKVIPHQRLDGAREVVMSMTDQARSRSRSNGRRPGAWNARGQSLLEFALVVPLMLALVGVTLDFARVYEVWMRLQAVTRDTAELLATDWTYTDQATAQAAADTRICTTMAGSPTCPSSVRPGAVSLVTVGAGSDRWRATVPAEYDFQTFFLWPVIQGLTGSARWTLKTSVTYEVIRYAG